MPSGSPLRILSSRVHPTIGRPGVGLDELHRREHLAVASRLKEAHIGRVRVDDIHVVKLDALAAKLPAKLPGHHEIGRDGGRRTVDQEEALPSWDTDWPS